LGRPQLQLLLLLPPPPPSMYNCILEADKSFSRCKPPATAAGRCCYCLGAVACSAAWLCLALLQYEVEAYFTDAAQGSVLNVMYFTKYWVGMNSTARTWPVYQWLDKYQYDSRSADAYLHWGTDANAGAQPDSAKSLCVAANAWLNYTSTSSLPGRSGSYRSWGWDDQNCNAQMASICKYLPQKAEYTFMTSGNTYVLNTTMVDAQTASDRCGQLGGHLASWTSLAEQNSVEQNFLSNNKLALPYHSKYWLGIKLTPGGLWPNFTFNDPVNTDKPVAAGKPWGAYKSSTVNNTEPNNTPAPQYCAVGNYTERMGSPSVFGWADAFCGDQFPFICRIRRECGILGPVYWRLRLRSHA
jgi:hypothetical protein